MNAYLVTFLALTLMPGGGSLAGILTAAGVNRDLDAGAWVGFLLGTTGALLLIALTVPALP